MEDEDCINQMFEYLKNTKVSRIGEKISLIKYLLNMN